MPEGTLKEVCRRANLQLKSKAGAQPCLFAKSSSTAYIYGWLRLKVAGCSQLPNQFPLKFAQCRLAAYTALVPSACTASMHNPTSCT